jgi:hypothetical protein
MKFTLIYDGSLPPTGSNSSSKASLKKWEIRKQFDPQLRELWSVRPDLAGLKEDPIIAKDGVGLFRERHHQETEPSKHRPARYPGPIQESEIDLCAPIRQGARTFFPLVRSSLALTCSLKILFLRNEPRGHLLQDGDLDNRIKTLCDALGIPKDDFQYDDMSLVDPVFCLVEDDALITGLDVRTEQLLSPRGVSKEARLVIEVDVRISHARSYNAAFGGD